MKIHAHNFVGLIAEEIYASKPDKDFTFLDVCIFWNYAMFHYKDISRAEAIAITATANLTKAQQAKIKEGLLEPQWQMYLDMKADTTWPVEPE